MSRPTAHFEDFSGHQPVVGIELVPCSELADRYTVPARDEPQIVSVTHDVALALSFRGCCCNRNRRFGGLSEFQGLPGHEPGLRIEPVPRDEIRKGHSVAARDQPQALSFLHPVPACPSALSTTLGQGQSSAHLGAEGTGVEPRGPFRDQEMIPHSDQGAVQAIVMGEGVDTRAVLFRDRAQSVAGNHLVVAPRHPLPGGKRCHPTCECIGVGCRNEELMRTLRFGRPPAVSSIEPVESIETDFGKFGGESEIDLMIQFDEMESDFVRHVQQRHAVVFGTRDDVAYREPARHVGPCLPGHLERPEVERLSVSSVVRERPSEVAFSPVVRGDREQPVPVEVPVELLQVVESGRGGRYEVPPAVIPPVDSKTVQSGGGGNELPEPRSPCR